MSTSGSFLDRSGLSYFWSKLKVPLQEDREALIELIDGGAKNLFAFDVIGKAASSGTTYSSDGVQYTVQEDMSVVLSGTASANTNANFRISNPSSAAYVDSLCDGGHVLSGCPSGGAATSKYRLRAQNSNASYAMIDTGNGILLNSKESYTNIFLSIIIQSGTKCDGLVFKPMICTKAAWAISKEYQPYRPSYQDLYERILALENQ